MKHLLLILMLVSCCCSYGTATDFQHFDALQVGNKSPITSKSVLDIQSTTAGALVPRMTTVQRTAISSPPDGLLVYDTTLHTLFEYNSSLGAWSIFTAGGTGALTASRAVVTDSNSLISTSAVTSTELGYLSGAAVTQGGLVYGNGSAFRAGTAGTSGDLAVSGGTGAPTWTTPSSSAGNSTIVKRDGSGNFSAGTITAALSGNASTSTAFASNPADCSANNYATTIAANGDLTCAQVSLTAGVSGTLPITSGGTGQTSASAAFNALSPMTTGGDLIYGGASGAGTRLANGSAGQHLQSNGTTLAPSWVTPASATPGGSDTQIQFNDSSSFGGSANLTFVKASGLTSWFGSSKFTIDPTYANGFYGRSGPSALTNSDQYNGATTATSFGSSNTSTAGTITTPVYFGSGDNNANSASAATGPAVLATGTQGGTSSTAATGEARVLTGDIISGSANTGLIRIITGSQIAGAGNSGLINITTGSSSGGSSGNITLQTGTAGSSRGFITLNGSSTVNTNIFAMGVTSQTIAGGGTITSTKSVNNLDSAGAVATSTSTVIATGFDGQILTVVNTGAFTITLKSGGNTNLPGATDYALTALDSISFIWLGSAWYTTSASVN